LRPEILTHLGDVGKLTLDTQALVLLNLGHPELVQALDAERMPDAGLQFLFHPFENLLV
jgi:hypothetical protein